MVASRESFLFSLRTSFRNLLHSSLAMMPWPSQVCMCFLIPLAVNNCTSNSVRYSSGVKEIDLLWSLLIITPVPLSRTVQIKLRMHSEIPGLFCFEDEHFDVELDKSNKSNAK